jgi:hypothetical protein
MAFDPSYRIVQLADGTSVMARCQPFIYGTVLTFTAVAAGGSVTNQINIDPGLPFILTELHCETDTDGTAIQTMVNRFLLFNITSGESQQLFANIAVPRTIMFGTVDLLRVLPSEVQIRPADTLTVTCVNNTGGALTALVRCSFRGYKLVNPQGVPMPGSRR